MSSNLLMKCVLYISHYCTHKLVVYIISIIIKLHDTSDINMSTHKLSTTSTSLYTSTWHIDVLALLWLVAHLNGQVGWVSLHLLPLFLLLSCRWPLTFWTCFDTVLSPCVEGGNSPASQEGLGQLRCAAQLTTSQLSSAPLQSLVHHCMHYCTDCDSDSVNTIDRRTNNTVTVTCGHDAAQEMQTNRWMYNYINLAHVVHCMHL